MADMRGFFRGQAVTIIEGELDSKNRPIYTINLNGVKLQVPVSDVKMLTIDGIHQKWRDENEKPTRPVRVRRVASKVLSVFNRSDY